MFTVAIDGPSGAGKSSVAKKIAEYFNIMYLDTGALYRAIGYYFIKNELDYNIEEVVNESIGKLLLDVKFEGNRQIIFLNGEDVTLKIRTDDVSMAASGVSAVAKTRDFLMETQREIARRNSVVMDGRDIGTVVVPNADVKIFLTASLSERAKRRFDELKMSDDIVKYEEVLSAMKQRDYNDTNRKVAPLKPAEDAVVCNTTNRTFEQVTKELIDIIKGKIKWNRI